MNGRTCQGLAHRPMPACPREARWLVIDPEDDQVCAEVCTRHLGSLLEDHGWGPVIVAAVPIDEDEEEDDG